MLKGFYRNSKRGRIYTKISNMKCATRNLIKVKNLVQEKTGTTEEDSSEEIFGNSLKCFFHL